MSSTYQITQDRIKLTPFITTISALPRHPHYIIGNWPLGLYALLLLALILRVTHYRAIPPLLGLYVACGILILEKWAEENDLDEDILLATSPTGYSHDELALQWLKHFEIHSRKSQVGVWRLLILDGYGSHLTYKFYEYAQKHYIELFRLPPHLM